MTPSTPEAGIPSGCPVCGFSEVRTDEVVDQGLVLLSECPRCEHRSTRRVPWPEAWQTSGASARWLPVPAEECVAA